MGPDPPGASTVLLEGDLVVSACCPQAVEMVSIQTAAVDSFEVSGILSVCLLDSVFIEQRGSGVFRTSDHLQVVAIFLPIDTPLESEEQSHINGI